MNFNEAREVARTGLHIRRQGWPLHRWFSLVRGLWWYQDATVSRPVKAADYVSADLLATDWTSIPRPLRNCPLPGTDPTPPQQPGGRPSFPNDWLIDIGPGDPNSPGVIIGGPGFGGGGFSGGGGAPGGDPAPGSVTLNLSGPWYFGEITPPIPGLTLQQ